MDVNSKVKELEDELKVLKAEIRNSLLDIREVILERANPLGEEHESAFIRMDLNTTARAMAAEAAGAEAAKAVHEAEDAEAKAKKDQEDAEASTEEKTDPEAETDGAAPKGKASRKKKGAKSDSKAEDSKEEHAKTEAEEPEMAPEPAPPQDAPPDPADIPPMYLKTPPPMDGTESLAAWIATALGTVGPQQLERVIAVRRLWGDLSPSTCEALARLEELIHSSRGQELSWLRTMQVLERLTPSH
jgi:chemotaxis protein histidine kinase CheA